MMDNLAGLGLFFGGLGLFFVGAGVIWWVSLQDRQTRRDAAGQSAPGG
ncbi:MAG: hypothetical protein JJ920_16340 [Roseitalea sp.]|nr:hypothetical protein [Roseitalea sp.]MBO6722708.1 hypothetical protein [Roseitalea sp.]MBO6744483.1 hypothetical protein [Roseitalea sp.]